MGYLCRGRTDLHAARAVKVAGQAEMPFPRWAVDRTEDRRADAKRVTFSSHSHRVWDSRSGVRRAIVKVVARHSPGRSRCMFRVQLTNFRCFAHTDQLEVLPITFLVGENSAG